ncbi:hypothetical protein JB92DRAFT_2720562, partial [Gautieria morchelliformis]
SMHSGLQQEVLHLYRRRVSPRGIWPTYMSCRALRVVRTKPVHTRPKFLLIIRHAFRSPDVSPRDFGAVEFLLRKRRKQVEMWGDPNVRDCWVSEDMQEWERRWRRV